MRLPINSLQIVIPTYNRARDLIACIQSLLAAGAFEDQIIVVDNYSQDDTISKVKDFFPEVILIQLENNLGAAKASNIGFKYVLDHFPDAAYVLRLDSDTVVAPNFFLQLLNGPEKSESIGILGPKIYFYDSPNQIWYAGADAHPWHFGALNTHIGEMDSPSNSQLKNVDYVWGAAMLIKRDVIQKTGGFDPDFFIYHEEIDFCRRVQTLGYNLVYVPDAHVWHKVGSSGNNAFTAYYWNRSKIFLYRKQAQNFGHRLLLLMYAFSYLVLDAILFRLKIKKTSGNRGPILHAFRGYFDGLRLPLRQF